METAAILDEALDKIRAADHEFLTAHEAAAFAGMLERASRKLDALKIAIVDTVDRNGPVRRRRTLVREDVGSVHVPHVRAGSTPQGGVRQNVPHPR